MRTALLLVLACVAVAMTCAPAKAEIGACAPRQDVIWGLGKTYGESRVSQSIIANGWRLELFMSRNGETWTLAASSPQQPDVLCPLASGSGWEFIPFKPWNERS